MVILNEDNLNITTIERHILDEQNQYPQATGVLTNLLYDIALAGKVISSKTNRAGLAEILGRTAMMNIQGEVVQKLDRFADLTIYRLNDHTGRLAVMASEEHDDLLHIPDRYSKGKYVLLFDPLDGSSNIDFNIPVGTIFAVYQRKSVAGPGTMDDCLQPARDLVAGGYIIYGSSTMFVYTTGQGVHGFTLDPTVGEFLLSHPSIKIPDETSYASANLGNSKYWSVGVQKYKDLLLGVGEQKKAISLRYVGSLVADFHRNLLAGGVFYYPADSKDPQKTNGKLRLLYEAGPLAFLAEQAGGYASDGRQNIMDIKPTSLHQRTPLFIGNRKLVKIAEEFISRYDKSAG
ncbi:class 1 fructose-bisphosphatase [Chloroflexota bacterium]